MKIGLALVGIGLSIWFTVRALIWLVTVFREERREEDAIAQASLKLAGKAIERERNERPTESTSSS